NTQELRTTLFPYTTLFRSPKGGGEGEVAVGKAVGRMTMPGGKVLLNAIVEANLGKSAVGKPLSIAPDIWRTLPPGIVIRPTALRSEEHTSELQSQSNLVCR